MPATLTAIQCDSFNGCRASTGGNFPTGLTNMVWYGMVWYGMVYGTLGMQPFKTSRDCSALIDLRIPTKLKVATSWVNGHYSCFQHHKHRAFMDCAAIFAPDRDHAMATWPQIDFARVPQTAASPACGRHPRHAAAVLLETTYRRTCAHGFFRRASRRSAGLTQRWWARAAPAVTPRCAPGTTNAPASPARRTVGLHPQPCPASVLLRDKDVPHHARPRASGGRP